MSCSAAVPVTLGDLVLVLIVGGLVLFLLISESRRLDRQEAALLLNRPLTRPEARVPAPKELL